MHDLFTKGLKLRWQEKVLPPTETITDILDLVWVAEEQKKQLSALLEVVLVKILIAKNYLPFHLS